MPSGLFELPPYRRLLAQEIDSSDELTLLDRFNALKIQKEHLSAIRSSFASLLFSGIFARTGMSILNNEAYLPRTVSIELFDCIRLTAFFLSNCLSLLLDNFYYPMQAFSLIDGYYSSNGSDVKNWAQTLIGKVDEMTRCQHKRCRA
jgi:hypothetical protein